MNKVIRLFLFALLALSPLSVLAQTSAVTATITDSDSVVWANGTFNVTFVPPQGNSQPPVWNGTLMTTAQRGPYTGTMNGSGVLSVSLPDTAYIQPPGSQWRFQLCPLASAPCTAVLVAVTGASPSYTTLFSNSVSAPRFSANGANAYGYSAVEINATPLPGGFFWNVTSGCQDQWNGSAFVCVSGSGFTAGGDLSGTSTSQTVIGLNGTLLSSLATGLLRNTTTTGVPTIATAAQILSACTGCAPLASPTFTGKVTLPLIATTSPCYSTSATPACGAATSGAANVAAGSFQSVTISTTAVTANSQILITQDASLSSLLGVTCNSNAVSSPLEVYSRSTGSSFAVIADGTSITSPLCFGWLIVN